MKALKVGDRIPEEVIATTRTDADGNFRLTGADIKGGNLPANADLDIVVASDVEFGSLGVVLDSQGRAKSSTSVVTHRDSSGVTAKSGAGVTPMLDTTCGWYQWEDRGQTAVKLGAHYSIANGMYSQFTYTSGSATTLGWAISTKKTGPFTADGGSSHSVVSTATVTFPRGDPYVEIDWTYFEMFLEAYSCDLYPNPTQYRLGPEYWLGGGVADQPGASQLPGIPPSAYCAKFVNAGMQWDQDFSNAWNYDWAADATSANIRAQTGYTSKTKLHVDFVEGGHYRLFTIRGVVGV